ncbi:MAG: hypothetical protein HQ522_15620, partial [Bacteroidetes bacterium]|nr:hypothetical protein [Bacteroidota bacterium]
NIEGCQKLQVSFKQNKVTAGCVYKSRSFGSRGTTLTEALNGLLTRIKEPAFT